MALTQVPVLQHVLLLVQCTVAGSTHHWAKCAGQLLPVGTLPHMLRNRKKYFPFLATVIVFPDLGNEEKTSSANVMSEYWPLPLWIPVAILPKCCFHFLVTASGGIQHAYLKQKVNIRQETAHLRVHLYTNSASYLFCGGTERDVMPRRMRSCDMGCIWSHGREVTCYSWEVCELPGGRSMSPTASTAPSCWAVCSVTWYTTCC